MQVSSEAKAWSRSRALWILLILVAAPKIYFVFHYNINWDEFYYLSHVHAFYGGHTWRLLQFFHVHLFSWLILLPGQEMAQIAVARLVMVALNLATALLVYRLVLRSFDAFTALFTLAVYLLFSEVMRMGASFRADGICAFLIVLALWLYWARERTLAPRWDWRAAAAGVSLALSFMVSMKTVLYGPFWVLLLIWQLHREGRPALRSIAAALTGGLLALVVLVGFQLLMRHLLFDLPPSGSLETGSRAVGGMASAGNKMFLHFDFLPQENALIVSLLSNLISWLLMGLGALLIFWRLLRGKLEKGDILAWGGLTLLATLLFYRNAFPYYYAFIMPGACLLTAPLFHGLGAWRARASGWVSAPNALLAMILLFLALGLGRVLVTHYGDRQAGQRAYLAQIHSLFPEPVAYIDRNAMVATFPRAGFFMSTWGMESYRQHGKAVFRGLLENHQPRFLLANTGALDVWRYEERALDPEGQLLAEDVQILKDHFLPAWGALYLPGKEVTMNSAGRAEVEILISGDYVLESEQAIAIEGVEISPGDKVALEQGRIKLSGAPYIVAALRAPQSQDLPGPLPADWPIYFIF